MKLTAHAYLVRGGSLEAVGELLEKEGVTTRGNPDYYAVSFESLGVDDVRGITDFASFAPLGDRKYILMQVQSATAEAQTALLKSMEEGTGRSIFFFIIPAGTFVLPTLASRCVILKLTADSPQPTAGKEFLELSYKERLAMAEKFGKDHDREGARLLVRSLLSVADQKKFDAKKLRDLLDADRYLSSSGSSPKSVIGHLALVL